MTSEILKGLRQILSPQPQAREPVTESEVEKEAPENYNFNSERDYELMGGEEKDLLSKCPSCGGDYCGPLLSRCEYCGVSRKVYYRDIGPKTTIFGQDLSLEEDSLFPDFGEAEVVVSRYSVRERAFGKHVQIGQEAEVTLVYAGEEAEIGNWTNLKALVSPRVKTGQEVVIDEAVVREADFGAYSNLGLVIVLSGGNVTFHSETLIRNLVIGPNVDHVSIGRYGDVGALMTVGNPGLTLGEESIIRKESNLSPEEYKEILQGVLGKFNPDQES
jgi:hypothetical protein